MAFFTSIADTRQKLASTGYLVDESLATVVFLGDYVSRGPDSREVIQAVIDLRRRCRVVAHVEALDGCPGLHFVHGGQVRRQVVLHARLGLRRVLAKHERAR